MDGSSIWAAWYGAILSTIVFAFAVYKHWKTESVRIRIKIYHDAVFHSVGNISKITRIEIYNSGKIPTTISEVKIEQYVSKFPHLRLEKEAYWGDFEDLNRPLPHFLEPGSHWLGLSNVEITEADLDAKNLYVMVHYAQSEKPKRSRLRAVKTYIPN